MNRRHGASLIELMVVMTITSTILILTGTLFQRLFMSDQLSTRAALLEVTTSRLAVQFRRDAYQAQQATRTVNEATGEQTLELRSESNPAVVYIGRADSVRRDIIGGDGKASHETYRLPGCLIEFTAPEAAATDDGNVKNGKPQIVTLAIERPHSQLTRASAVAPRRNLTLDAELGRDRRLISLAAPVSAESTEESK